MNLEHRDSIPNANSFPEGTQIRLRNDPLRVGACTGRSRVQVAVCMVQVRIDGLNWYPNYELELLDEPPPEDSEALGTGRFGRSADLRRRLTHIQLSGGLADVVYSMHTTNTDFYAHQYKPVLSFLDSPSRGILIADEVGLGKTIEAGLLWTELRARIYARRLPIFLILDVRMAEVEN